MRHKPEFQWNEVNEQIAFEMWFLKGRSGRLNCWFAVVLSSCNEFNAKYGKQTLLCRPLYISRFRNSHCIFAGKCGQRLMPPCSLCLNAGNVWNPNPAQKLKCGLESHEVTERLTTLLYSISMPIPTAPPPLRPWSPLTWSFPNYAFRRQGSFNCPPNSQQFRFPHYYLVWALLTFGWIYRGNYSLDPRGSRA